MRGARLCTNSMEASSSRDEITPKEVSIGGCITSSIGCDNNPRPMSKGMSMVTMSRSVRPSAKCCGYTRSDELYDRDNSEKARDLAKFVNLLLCNCCWPRKQQDNSSRDSSSGGDGCTAGFGSPGRKSAISRELDEPMDIEHESPIEAAMEAADHEQGAKVPKVETEGTSNEVCVGKKETDDSVEAECSKPKVRTHKLILTDEHSDPLVADKQTCELLQYNLNKDQPFHRIELNKAIWEVPKRYTDLKPVGAGSYGLVSSAYDNKNEMKIAIKKLSRPFQSSIHAKRTYRELTLLAHMKHENVIGLMDVFSPCRSFKEFNDVYLVTHLMGADLGGIIKTQRLSDDHIQFLTYQILRGLKYIHSAGIIHRDLKTVNLAVTQDCELKLLDFGLARHAEAEMTGYVATRWYRAPEIMLNWMRYNRSQTFGAVDIWSVGCILAEMITARTLFPGKDHIDQLLRIMTMCGTPDADFMKKITSEEARNYIKTLPVMKRKNFYDIFEGANPLAIDLLDQMLKLDPDLRPTAEQALAHPYLAQYADPNDEPTTSNLYDESFEDKDYNVDDWKQLVWKEIVKFKIANG